MSGDNDIAAGDGTGTGTSTNTTTTGTGSGTPETPNPSSATPRGPGQGQGQNWFMNLLAEKLGFGSAQDFISSIIDKIFGQFDLSGIPFIGDLLSGGRSQGTQVAGNEGPGDNTGPSNPTPETTTVGTQQQQQSQTEQPQRRGLDGMEGEGQRQFTQVAGQGANNTTTTDPSLTPSTPTGPGAG